MTSDLLAAVVQLPRQPLVDATETASLLPGAYLQFWVTERSEVTALLPAWVTQARYPVYVGCARSLRQRLQRYRHSLADLPGVDLNELHVAVLPCDSTASALYAETCLLDSAVQGVFNKVGGWGSKIPGSRRTQQTSSAVDALFAPGRRWTRPPSAVDQVRARCQLIATLAAIDPAGPRWPPLITP